MQTNKKERETGIPKSVPEMLVWIIGEGKPEHPSFKDAGLEISFRYNELISKWSVNINIGDNVHTRIHNEQNDCVYMYNKTITVYDIRNSANISILTDRKHKHERYTQDGKKSRRYQWVD